MSSARDNIPSPPGLPIIGNVLDVQNEVPIKGLEHLVDIYGPIHSDYLQHVITDLVTSKLNFFGKERIVIADAELLGELCDEKRFWKTPGDGLAALNESEKPTGLFSARSEESMDWQQAHRTLMPAFGPMSIAGMAGEMHDIASQLVLKWARMGSSHRINVTSDFTRLTLDTIALCAMDYRFNSFYQDELHPFVEAMTTTLSASSDRLKIGSLLRKMLPWDRSAQKVKEDGAYMGKLAKELVQVRRDNPTEKRDLLNAMVKNTDPKTGENMSDDLITANMITFLIAGHETTSGLLSFAFLNLLKSPEAYFKVQKEVDEVVGRDKVEIKHLNHLKYVDAVLKETLRLTPTAPAFTRSIRRDSPRDVEELAGGKYALNRGDSVLCLLAKAQTDPKVYGDDANEFKPERMLEENFKKLPRGAWMPFGTGVRSCIGRAFAWQEAQMAVALVFQNFNLRLDDPTYEMKIKQTLTLKPDGFFMRATLRDGISATGLQAMLTSSDEVVHSAMKEGIRRSETIREEGLKPMTILYGSNTGTCLSLAQKFSIEARRHGYQANALEMDAAVESFPKDQPTVVITASYEGQPPDNAAQFVGWLETLPRDDRLRGSTFAVFGCGHSDWANTYQRIPKLVDDLLQEHSAERLAPRGFADASQGEIFTNFDTWTEEVFWPKVSPSGASDEAPAPPTLDVELSRQDRSSFLRQDVKPGSIVKAKRLTAAGEPEKRHLEIDLPSGMTYQAGDYLAILPVNPSESITRTMKHFALPSDATITIHPDAATFLPTGVTLSVVDLLKGYMELSQPLTKKDLANCLASCRDPSERKELERISDEEGLMSLTQRRMSLLDLLTKYGSIDMSFATFTAMLPPLRPRHYSISSSSLADPKACTITYSIIDEAAKSGLGRYVGVTGAYLSSLNPGDEILVSVRATNRFFHLPADPTTPILMLGAGTGIAPFRGFIEERAQQIAAGRPVAKALMFMGCRSATRDRLYAEEIDAWSKAGAIDVRYAFSQEAEESQGCRYIQDRLLKDREDVLRMWEEGAKFFVCGGPAVSEQVGIAARQLLIDARLAESGEVTTKEEADEWFRQRRNERFIVDVFA